jgi:acyl-CoA synthetase (AMP-forming)/AMP-acid ligase II
MLDSWFFDRLNEFGDETALVWNDQRFSYRDLIQRSEKFKEQFRVHGIGVGKVVAIEGTFSPNACAVLLALASLRAVLAPLTPLMRGHRESFLAIAEAQLLLEFNERDEVDWTFTERPVTNELTRKLISRQSPGLVIFSSGSTGTPKAILHDLSKILEKYKKRRQKKTTLSFLLFDHIGGIDTYFNTVGSGGTLVTVSSRNPQFVAKAIAEYRVHTLPTSPTFLNLLLISGACDEFDMSSLKVIAYGTEPMPESTLKRLHEVLPDVALVQTYGMSELGVLRSRSKSSESLWIKFSGDGFETKIVDGILWVKAESAMLGYLNAPDLFDSQGWLNTQDAVEVDGEYIRILGRASELINVGGQKVYPAEVESFLLNLENVVDVSVYGKAHPMMGQVVAARFNLKESEPLDLFKRRMNLHCRGNLANYQIPVFVELIDREQFGVRFKKRRND